MHPLPQPTPDEQAQSRARLQAMGIDPEIPREAVRLAHEAWAHCTNHDVASMAGFLAWGLPLRHLRDKLCPLGWRVGRAKNFETVVSPDQTFAIASAAGDSRTGTAGMPSTRTERGPQTKVAVAVNEKQLSFDPRIVGESKPSVQRATWFLLYYYDKRRNEIRIELSRPIEFTAASDDRGDHGIATHFEPRLYLPAISLAHNAPVGDEPEQTEDKIDVPVARRRAND